MKVYVTLNKEFVLENIILSYETTTKDNVVLTHLEV